MLSPEFIKSPSSFPIMEKIVWRLLDSSNSLVGFFFVEDGKMILEDLQGNQFEVTSKTTLKQAVRIILHKQSTVC